jgi:hypothetical protein
MRQLVQLLDTLLNDDNGVSTQAYYDMLAIFTEPTKESRAVGHLLSTMVDATDGRFYTKSGLSLVAAYDAMMEHGEDS